MGVRLATGDRIAGGRPRGVVSSAARLGIGTRLTHGTNLGSYFRWRMRDRMRRFLRPIFRRPFPRRDAMSCTPYAFDSRWKGLVLAFGKGPDKCHDPSRPSHDSHCETQSFLIL